MGFLQTVQDTSGNFLSRTSLMRCSMDLPEFNALTRGALYMTPAHATELRG